VLNLTPTPAWSHGSDPFRAECGGQTAPPSDCPASGGVGAWFSGIGLSAYTFDPGKNRILFYGGSSASSQYDCVLRELRMAPGDEGFKVVASTPEGYCYDNFDSVIYHAASFDNIRERFFRVGFGFNSPDVRAAYYPLGPACCRTNADCASGQFCNQDTSLCDTCTGKPNGASCSDGNLCNGAETCQSGACTTGTPPPLDDGDAFTADFCDPIKGAYHVPFQYRQRIDITNPGSTALYDYQVQIPATAFDQAALVAQGKLSATRQDIVVTTSDGLTVLPHYPERVGFTIDGTTPTYTLWVKVPSLPAGSSVTSVYVYYGQAGSASPPIAEVESTFVIPDPECASFESPTRFSDGSVCWGESIHITPGDGSWAFFSSYVTPEAYDGRAVGFHIVIRTNPTPNGTSIDFYRPFDLPTDRYALRYDVKQFVDQTTPGRATFFVQDAAYNAIGSVTPPGNYDAWHYANETTPFDASGPTLLTLTSHVDAPAAGGRSWWYMNNLRFRKAPATPALEPTAVANGGEETP
jgi:hypothetical protein